jgi:DNA-binding LacI/PurR family transcriptional regulator
MQDIADETGYSLMTVSRVIRNHGSASAKARKAVEECAARMGYEYNPEVSRLMSLMRSGQRDQYHETLGILWFFDREKRRKNESITKLEQGILHRAEQLGYRLDPIQFSDYEEHPQRLFDVLDNRGVRGVILTPLVETGENVKEEFDFPWDDFAWVSFGNTHANREFHRVGHHHFFGMELALRHLTRDGVRRPAFYISEHLSDTVHHAYSGSFFAHHPLGSEKAIPLKLPADIDLGDIAGWCKQHNVDALISPHTETLTRLRDLPRLVSLHLKDGEGVCGVDQQNRILGTYAVDMLVAQLHRDEKGLPEEPKLMLNKGRWVGA